MPKYIHELGSWPTYTYDLSKLMAPLEEVNTQRGRLLGTLETLGFEGIRETEIEALAEELIKSSAIEGERLDVESVRNSVARHLGLERGGLARSDHYIDGLVVMSLDAAQNYNQPLTAERIFNWHAAIFPTGRNVHGPLTTGAWRDDRNGPMAVVSEKRGHELVHFEAPEAKRLNKEMKKYLDWFEASNEPSLVLKAGIAHIWFETIHPMDDGNGRIGRNIMDLMLARADQVPHRPYSLSSFIHSDRNSYYNILEATQKGSGDYTEWLVWFVTTLSKSLDEALTTISKALVRTRFWKHHKDSTLNKRQREVISRMLLGWEGKMTNKKYAQLTKCSNATATRDLGDLVQKSILILDAAQGRGTSYSLILAE